KIAGTAFPPAAEIREHVDPGTVEVRVTSQTMPDFAQSQQAAAGATITFDVASFTAKPVPVPVQTETKAERRRSRVYLAYVLGGLGLVEFGIGSYLGVRAGGDYDKQFDGAMPDCEHGPSGPICSQAGFDAVNSAGRLADEGTIVGAIGL